MSEPGPGDGARRPDPPATPGADPPVSAPGGMPALRPKWRHPVWWGLMHTAEEAERAALRGVHPPAWRRRTLGEPRWPVDVAVGLAIVLQLVLAGHLLLRPLPRYFLPALEVALLAGLAIADPGRLNRVSRDIRWARILLILLITATNAGSAVLLIRELLTSGHGHINAVPLLASAANIWATNVIAFALWYWEFDRGGPVHRAHGTFQYLDFLFPQMTVTDLVRPDWEPRFVDYLYLSYTNATAFSPTDVMPLARWAKLTMLVQSAVSLALGALVIARAVNIL